MSRKNSFVVDTELLRTFELICRMGTLKAASEEIHRTPSAVSLQLRKLENKLETELFERRGSKLIPNESGLELVSYCNKILAINQEIGQVFISQKRQRNLKLGICESLSQPLLPTILSLIKTSFDFIQFHVSVDRADVLVEEFRSKNLDIMITKGRESEFERYNSSKLFSEGYVWVASKNSTHQNGEKLKIGTSSDASYRRYDVIKSLMDQKADFDEVLISKNTSALLGSVLADYTVSAIPSSVYQQYKDRLQVLEGFPLLPETDVLLVHQIDRTNHLMAFTLSLKNRLSSKLPRNICDIKNAIQCKQA